MPKTDQRRPRTIGPVAFFAAAALLASIGIGLLLNPPAPGHHQAASPTVTPSRPPSSAPQIPATSAPASAPAAPASASSSAQPTQVPAVLPQAIETAADEFTVAWASHDARPGHDGSYDDAARRAAAYASPQLAAQLTTSSAGTARQWGQWTAAHAVVTAQITATSIPDGAPAPTATSAYARVRFRLTVTPATAGQPAGTDEQVALLLQRNQAGTWVVTALPNA